MKQEIKYETMTVGILYQNYTMYKYNKEVGKTVIYTNHNFDRIADKEIVIDEHITAILEGWIIPSIEITVTYTENKNDATSVNYNYNTGKKFIRSIIAYIESGRYKEELTIGEISDFWKVKLPIIYIMGDTNPLFGYECKNKLSNEGF